ncbi:hypothetical protein AB0L97_28495, partial [Nocardia sp. NPDC051911]|uniref:hypothetical protein n=1 Tax=Nocardia sp. NPDC051911 TaxID=3154648 RepID=UPI00342E91B1
TLLRDLYLPDWRDFGVEVTAPGATRHEATRVRKREPQEGREHQRRRRCKITAAAGPRVRRR